MIKLKDLAPVDDVDESKSSEAAKKRGLYHIGFGNYSMTPDGPIAYKTINGVLTRFAGPKEPEKKPEPIKAPEDDSTTAEPMEKPDIKSKEEYKPIGITDIAKINAKTKHPTYSFKYNGRPGVIVVTDQELEDYSAIADVIKHRIKQKEEDQKKKAMGIDVSKEKDKVAKSEKAKLYYLRQKELEKMQQKLEPSPSSDEQDEIE